MGAGANSSRNKALNDRRERAAGRRDDRGPEQEAIQDAEAGAAPASGRGSTGGASGKGGRANRQPGNTLGEGGGGGGGAPRSELIDVNPSTRRTRKRD